MQLLFDNIAYQKDRRNKEREERKKQLEKEVRNDSPSLGKNFFKTSPLLVSVLIISLILSLLPGGCSPTCEGPDNSYISYIGNTGYEPWYHYIADVVNSANGNLYLSAKDISIRARGFNIGNEPHGLNKVPDIEIEKALSMMAEKIKVSDAMPDLAKIKMVV